MSGSLQMISDGEKVYVLEFSARTGGGVKYLLIKQASGFDVIKAVVDLTVGNKPHVDKQPPKSKYMVNSFIYCKPGFFDHLEGFEELKSQGIISEYFQFKPQGTEFDGTVENSGDRVGGFTVQGNTVEEITERHTIARNTLKVIDTYGNDIMRHDLLVDIKF